MLNFDFLERFLGILSPTRFDSVYDFSKENDSHV